MQTTPGAHGRAAGAVRTVGGGETLAQWRQLTQAWRVPGKEAAVAPGRWALGQPRDAVAAPASAAAAGALDSRQRRLAPEEANVWPHSRAQESEVRFAAGHQVSGGGSDVRATSVRS
jgi:hypothetical protein